MFLSRPERCLACGCPANTATEPASRHEPALTPLARGTWRTLTGRGPTSVCCLRLWWLVLRTASNQHCGSGQAPFGSTRRSTLVLASELLREELSRHPCASGRLQACSGSRPLTLFKPRVHSLRQPPLHPHPRHCSPYVFVPRLTRTRMPICLPPSCDPAREETRGVGMVSCTCSLASACAYRQMSAQSNTSSDERHCCRPHSSYWKHGVQSPGSPAFR